MYDNLFKPSLHRWYIKTFTTRPYIHKGVCFCARIADFSDKLNGFADLKNTVGIADQLKILVRIPDFVCLEVRIVDRIINFRSALCGILVFGRLIFSVSVFFSAKNFM